jgi:hypothetical protein
MPASSILEIYNVAPAVEDAVVTVLSNQNISAFSTRAKDDVPADAVMVMCDLSGGLGHYQQVAGEWREDAWSAVLVCEVYTQRPQEPASNSNGIVGRHAEMVAEVMYHLSRPMQALPPLLPHHEILRLDFAGLSQSVDSDGAYDVSRLNYELIIGAKPDAWPE